MLTEKTLYVYTDGSSLPKARRGGLAGRFVYEDPVTYEVIELDFEYTGYKGASNNEMELYACAQGLRECLKFDKLDCFDYVVVKTDSMYVKDNYTKAMFDWPKRSWKRINGAPVLNVKLWKELVRQIKKLGIARKQVKIEWVKGHAKNKHNKAVDKLAKKSAKNAANKQISSLTDVRRKISHKSVELGSVKIRGQKITIRIITSRRLIEHRVWRYMYEVISKKSKYHKNVDYIYYKEVLRTGHCYSVRLNKNNEYPMICTVYGEIDIKNKNKQVVYNKED